MRPTHLLRGPAQPNLGSVPVSRKHVGGCMLVRVPAVRLMQMISERRVRAVRLPPVGPVGLPGAVARRWQRACLG